MIVWLLIILFGIMTIVFLMGKGSFLIAGYNTASAKDKQKYDDKKLCQCMGVGTGIITLGMLAAAFLDDIGIIVMLVGIVAGLVWIFISSETICINKQYVMTKKVWYQNGGVWGSVLGIIVAIVIVVLMFVGSVKVEYHGDYFHVSASLSSSADIYYNDIEKIDYVQNIDIGSRSMGVGSYQLQAGSFKNDLYGTYKLYSYAQCKEYVVLETELGTVVINGKNSQETKELYQNIQSKLNK